MNLDHKSLYLASSLEAPQVFPSDWDDEGL